MNDHIEDLLNQVIDYAWDHNIGCSTIPLHEDQGPLVDTEARLTTNGRMQMSCHFKQLMNVHIFSTGITVSFDTQINTLKAVQRMEPTNVRYQLSFQCISQTFQKNQQTLTNS